MAVSVLPNKHSFNFRFTSQDKLNISNQLSDAAQEVYVEYWEAWKRHADRMAYVIPFAPYKNKILVNVNIENPEDVRLFFQHLEATVYDGDGHSHPDLKAFAFQLFNNRETASRTALKNKLLEILKKEAYVDAFIKNCPQAMKALANNPLILCDMAKQSKYLALSLFKKPSLISKNLDEQNNWLGQIAAAYSNDLEIADLFASRSAGRNLDQQGKPGLQHFIADLVNDAHKELREANLLYLRKHPHLSRLLDKEDLAFIFGCENEEAPININYFFDTFNFFIKHNPTKLKELFAEIAEIETTDQIPPYHPRVLTGIENIRQHLFAADKWADKLPREKRQIARTLNERCANVLCKYPNIIKAIYADDNRSKNLQYSANLPKLLSLTRHSSTVTKTFTHSLAHKNLLTPAATGRIAPVMAQTLSHNSFNQWWKGLKNTAFKLVNYVKEKLPALAGVNSLSAEDKKNELQIINAVLAQPKVKGKLFISMTEELPSIINLLNQDGLEPQTLKALANDRLLWPKIAENCYPVSLSDDQKLNFLKKSPHFYAKLVDNKIIDLLLNHRYIAQDETAAEQQKAAKSAKIYNQFDQLLLTIYLKRDIENDQAVIERLLIDADPDKDAKRLLFLADKSSFIAKTIVEKGYLHKIFLTNSLSTEDLEDARVFINRLASSEFSKEQQQYVLNFFNQRGTSQQLYQFVSDKINEENLIFDSGFESSWLITQDNGNVSLQLKDESIAEYVASIRQKIKPEFLDEALFRAAIYIAHDVNSKDRLNEFLSYKLSRFGDHSILSHLKKYLHNKLTPLLNPRNQPTPDFKQDIEHCIKQPLLAEQLEFPGYQLFSISQMNGLDPLIYKSIANNGLYWDQIQLYVSFNYPSESASKLTSLIKNSPYLFLNSIEPGFINNSVLKTSLIMKFILNTDNGIAFQTNRKLFFGMFSAEDINALLVRDHELRNLILNNYTQEKFDLLIDYFPLIPGLLSLKMPDEMLMLTGEQLFTLAKKYPVLNIPQNSQQFMRIIQFAETSEINDENTLLFKKIIENSLLSIQNENKSDVTEAFIHYLSGKSGLELLNLTTRLNSPLLTQAIVQNEFLFKEIISMVDINLPDDQLAKVNNYIQTASLIMKKKENGFADLNKILSELSGPQLFLLAIKIPSLTELIQKIEACKSKLTVTYLTDYLAANKDFSSIKPIIDPIIDDKLIVEALRKMTGQQLLSTRISNNYKEKILADEKCVDIIINDVATNNDRQYSADEITIISSILIGNKLLIEKLMNTDPGTKTFINLYFLKKAEFDKIFDLQPRLKSENVLFHVLNHPQGFELVKNNPSLIIEGLLNAKNYQDQFNILLSGNLKLLNLLKETSKEQFKEQLVDLAIKYSAVATLSQQHIDIIFAQDLSTNIIVYKKLKDNNKVDLCTTLKDKIIATTTEVEDKLLLIDQLPELKNDISILITDRNLEKLAELSKNNAYLRQQFLQNPGFIFRLKDKTDVLLSWLYDGAFINQLDAAKINQFLATEQPAIIETIIDFLNKKEYLLNQLDLSTLAQIYSSEFCSAEFLIANPSILTRLLNDADVEKWQADIVLMPALIDKLMQTASVNDSVALALKQSLVNSLLFGLQILNSGNFNEAWISLLKESILQSLQDKSFCQMHFNNAINRPALLRILRSNDYVITTQLWTTCSSLPLLALNFIKEKDFTKELVTDHAEVYAQLIKNHAYDKNLNILLDYSTLQILLSAENKELSKVILSNTLYKGILINNHHPYSALETEINNELDKIEIKCVEDVFAALAKLKNDEIRLKDIANAEQNKDFFISAYQYKDLITDKDSAVVLSKILSSLVKDNEKPKKLEPNSSSSDQPKVQNYSSIKITDEENKRFKLNQDGVKAVRDKVNKLAKSKRESLYQSMCKSIYEDAKTHSRSAKGMMQIHRDMSHFRANQEYRFALGIVKKLEIENKKPDISSKEINEALIKNFHALYEDVKAYIQNQQFLLAEQSLTALDETFLIFVKDNSKESLGKITDQYVLANLLKLENFAKYNKATQERNIKTTFYDLCLDVKDYNLVINDNLFKDISIDLINNDEFYDILKQCVLSNYSVAKTLLDVLLLKAIPLKEPRMLARIKVLYLAAAMDSFQNNQNEENLKNGAKELDEFFKNHFSYIELLNKQSIPLQIVIATGNSDLILFFLRTPELSKKWKSDANNVELLQNYALNNDELGRSIAKCLYFYKHLHVDATITNAIGNHLGYHNEKSMLVDERLQLLSTPRQTTVNGDSRRSEAKTLEVVQPSVLAADVPVNDNVDSVLEEFDSSNVPPPPPLPGASQAEEAVDGPSNGPVPPPPPPPPSGKQSKKGSNDTAKAENNDINKAVATNPIKKWNQDPNIKFRAVFEKLLKNYNELKDKNSMTKGLRHDLNFIKMNFGYFNENKNTVAKKSSLETFNEKIAPHLGEMIERINQFIDNDENKAYEFFTQKVNARDILTNNYYDESTQKFSEEFKVPFKNIYNVISTQINEDQKKLVYDFYPDRKPMDSFIKVIDSEQKVQKESRTDFEKHIVPSIAFVYEKIKEQIDTESKEGAKELTGTDAYTLFKEKIPDSFKSKFDDNFYNNHFQPLFETMCQKAKENVKKPAKVFKKNDPASQSKNANKPGLSLLDELRLNQKAKGLNSANEGKESKLVIPKAVPNPLKTKDEQFIEDLETGKNKLTKVSEEELQLQREERRKRAIENTPEGLFRNVLQGKFILANGGDTSADDTEDLGWKSDSDDEQSSPKSRKGTPPTSLNNSTTTISKELNGAADSSTTSTVVDEKAKAEVQAQPSVTQEKLPTDAHQNGNDKKPSIEPVNPKEKQATVKTGPGSNPNSVFNQNGSQRGRGKPNPPAKAPEKKSDVPDFRANLKKTGNMDHLLKDNKEKDKKEQANTLRR